MTAIPENKTSDLNIGEQISTLEIDVSRKTNESAISLNKLRIRLFLYHRLQ
jgi:hypothetical protein